MKKLMMSVTALAALAACDAPTQSGYFGVTDPIATSRAAGMFQAVCLNNNGNLSAARQTLAGLPVILNPDDDIYYSTESAVSFKITPLSDAQTICSMVWDPVEDNDQSIAALRGLDSTAELRDNNDGSVSAFHYGAP